MGQLPTHKASQANPKKKIPTSISKIPSPFFPLPTGPHRLQNGPPPSTPVFQLK